MFNIGHCDRVHIGVYIVHVWSHESLALYETNYTHITHGMDLK